jgi:ureidoacrylate peracid hydrolase
MADDYDQVTHDHGESGFVLPASTTALVVVDMQNGFCHPKGTVGAQLDISEHRAIVPRIRELVQAAHDVGVPVFWSQQQHLPGDVALRRHRLSNHLQKLAYVPCLRGTWDAEILDELQPVVEPRDVLISKHRASAFYNTTLEVHLRMLGIDTLVIAGVSTSYCVDSTIRDAYARDFDLLIVEDACAAPWRDLHDAVMKNSAIFHGAVATTRQTLAALRSVATRRPGSGDTEAAESLEHDAV